MKYKINHWRCYWLSYKDTKLAFFDWLDNDLVGTILTYFLYYLFSVVLFPIFLILSFIWYVKRVYAIKKKLPFLDISITNDLKSRKIIVELTHQHEDKGQ